MLCHHTSTWEKQPVSQPRGTEDLEQVRTDQVQHTGAHCPASILRQLPGSQLQQKTLGCCKSCAVPAAPWGCGGVRHPSRGEQSVGTWGTQLHVCSGALNCSPGSADGASSISVGHCRSSESQLTPKHPCPVPVPNPSCLKIGG